MSASVKIRVARPEDLQAINDIYNHYVLHSTCTYQENGGADGIAAGSGLPGTGRGIR